MTGVPALGGWVLAGLVTLAALTLRRTLAARMEVIARACHELRGPLTAARLGSRPGSVSSPRCASTRSTANWAARRACSTI